MRNIKITALFIFILGITYGFAQSKKAMVLSVEKHNNVSDEKRMELISFFQSRSNSDYYVFPAIPSRKLRKARKRAYIDKMDVLLLIDTQLFGPAKNFILIGKSGVYFKNGWVSANPGRHFIPFDEFKTKEIKIKGDEIGIGDLSIDITGSYAELEFIMTLLKDLQSKV
ncbi:MAG: hypothetical protein V4506_09525 [Bacteroidota bacterium]